MVEVFRIGGLWSFVVTLDNGTKITGPSYGTEAKARLEAEKKLKEHQGTSK